MTASKRFWICAGVTALNAFISTGFTIAALLAAPSDTNAMYCCVRSVVLALMIVLATGRKSRPGIAYLAWIMVLIQFGDAYVGWVAQDTVKTFGPIGVAVATLAALLAMRSESARAAE